MAAQSPAAADSDSAAVQPAPQPAQQKAPAAAEQKSLAHVIVVRESLCSVASLEKTITPSRFCLSVA
jgi:hypothetical protein